MRLRINKTRIAAGICCLALMSQWVRSYHKWDTLLQNSEYTRGWLGFRVESCRGIITLGFKQIHDLPNGNVSFRYMGFPAEAQSFIHRMRDGDLRWSFLGFSLTTFSGLDPSAMNRMLGIYVARGWLFTVPYWAVLASGVIVGFTVRSLLLWSRAESENDAWEKGGNTGV